MIKQALYILILTVVVSAVVNWVSPNQISWVGHYREVNLNRPKPVKPPEPDAGDPPYIDLDLAVFDHGSGQGMFIDARDPDEFECGTIPGSLNVPFEHMPDVDDLTPYFDSALGFPPRDQRLVVFCSGEDCDLSIHLSRNLQAVGYTNLAIFFGGFREWERWVGELERRRPCDE
ncbi:MAG: rhodanese-like domain-containing protein [bacterium]